MTTTAERTERQFAEVASPPDVEARGITVRYGATVAVDDVSFTLTGGRIHGLLGRNGSGKSSLLSVLAAFRPASAGQARVGGAPVFEDPNVTQQVCLIRSTSDTVEHTWPDDRVRHALAFAAATRPRWDGDMAGRLVERFGLPLRARVESLSRGQRAALGVVLGLASRAPLTMFDEPHLGLDAPARYAFYDLLLEDVMTYPRTIVLSTHLIDEIASLLDEVVLIHQGRLLLHEDADTLRSRATSLVGAADAVERLSAGMTVLGEKRLGPTMARTVLGRPDDDARAAARTAGVELGPVPLQDLFVHLTDRPAIRGEGGPR